MIVGERKPIDEIRSMVKDNQQVLILGCGTCVSVCIAELGTPNDSGLTRENLPLQKYSYLPIEALFQ